MVKFIIFATVYSLAFMSSVYGISTNQCRDGGLIPENVVLNGCESDDICKIKYNGVFNVTMEFKAPHYMESMTPVLIGKTALGSFNLTGRSIQNDGCGGVLNTFCPVVEKELIKYRYLTQLAVLPLVPITMEFSVMDKDLNETVVCFNFNISPTL